ncbi:hypothetical protein LQZ19_06220 [Treponema primitia]|uniref:hypothetical protein n=1 Tax=Treponema primitia TaxID=88058 RepID=UPI00397EAB1B
MENQTMGTPDRSDQGLRSDGSFHSLISLADFKEILGIDDRDDACYPAGSLSRYFCSFILLLYTGLVCHGMLKQFFIATISHKNAGNSLPDSQILFYAANPIR